MQYIYFYVYAIFRKSKSINETYYVKTIDGRTNRRADTDDGNNCRATTTFDQKCQKLNNVLQNYQLSLQAKYSLPKTRTRCIQIIDHYPGTVQIISKCQPCILGPRLMANVW